MRSPTARVAPVLLLSILVPSLRSQEATAGKPVHEAIREEGMERSQVMAILDHLTNRIGPRLTGSDNCTNACEWAVDKLKEFGLENARMEKWGTFPVGFNRGQWSGEMVQPEPMTLVFGTPAWTPGTRGPITARAVLEPKNEEELETRMEELRGAWVIGVAEEAQGRRGGGRRGDAASRPAAPPDGSPAAPDPGPVSRPAASPEAAAFRSKRAKAYETMKIAGVVTQPTATDRNYPDQVRVFGSHRVQWDNLPTQVRISLRRDQHAKIIGLLQAREKVTLRFDIRNYFKKGPVDLYNVVADIPGTELPNEYVIIGGHIDSWHQATGTTDNGTGTATTLEAARILAAVKAKPKRTIRFMLWSGEEQNLLGSAGYVNRNRDILKGISGVFVHDAGTNYVGGITCTEEMKSDIERAFEPIMGLDPQKPFVVTARKGISAGGSDHGSFLAAGVPGFSWNQKGTAVYGRTWHSQWDTYDAAIEEYQKHSSVVIATGALGVANLDNLLSRENLRQQGGQVGGFARQLLGAETDGLKITSIQESGFAKTAGLKAGDEIVAVDGEPVTDLRGIFSALAGEAGSPIKITVKRDGATVVLEAKRPGLQISRD